MEMCADGTFPLAIPTWVTLDDLRHATDISSLMDATITSGPKWYHTHSLGVVGPRAIGHRALCWPGDASYDTGDPATPGARNRVIADEHFGIVERIRSAD